MKILITAGSGFIGSHLVDRLIQAFGPRAQAETVTNIFLRQALSGQPIIIHGSGKQFRQFIYINDLIEGCLACLKPEARNEVFNFSGAEKVSILKIAETIQSIWKEHNVTITFKPSREGDYHGKEIDSSKAHQLLGWAPLYSYEEAMKKHMAWFKRQTQAVKS